MYNKFIDLIKEAVKREFTSATGIVNFIGVLFYGGFVYLVTNYYLSKMKIMADIGKMYKKEPSFDFLLFFGVGIFIFCIAILITDEYIFRKTKEEINDNQP